MIDAVRVVIAGWLLDLAVRVEPRKARGVTAQAAPAEDAKRRNAAQARARTAGDLRCLADTVEAGTVLGFRVSWSCDEARPRVSLFMPSARGDA